jgi:hypothetical protein
LFCWITINLQNQSMAWAIGTKFMGHNVIWSWWKFRECIEVLTTYIHWNLQWIHQWI